MNDEALVKQAVRGDAAAKEEIFNRLADMMFRISMIYAGSDRELGKDLTQRSLAKVFENLDSLGKPYNLCAWAARITHNVCLDHFRSEKREKTGLAEFERLCQTEYISPEEVLMKKECLRIVREAMACEDNSEVLATAEMFYNKEMSVSLISRKQSISESAVTTRLFRFRARIRKAVLKHLSGGRP